MLFTLPQNNKIKGFTLIELMVAITISSIIMLGVVSLYSSARKGQKSNESLARIQESMRFATDMISKDIRMAGYTGCRSITVVNAVDDTTSFQYQIDTTPIIGYEAASVPASFPAIGINAGERVASTDAIVILRASSVGHKVTAHNPYTGEITVDTTVEGIEKDDLVAITDCNHAAIFQVSGPATPTTTIEHNVVSATPGNCWQNLGPFSGTRPPCTANGTQYLYSDNARLHKYIMRGYFIGVSTSGLSKSLYVLDLNKGVTTAHELVEGVENLQITYGIDPDLGDDDTFPVHYIKADDGTMNFSNVVAVRLGMLLSSIRDVKANNPPSAKSYTLAGTIVTPAVDKKLRFSYNTSVKIRNKGAQ